MEIQLRIKNKNQIKNYNSKESALYNAHITGHIDFQTTFDIPSRKSL